jgi:SAM-dependent methyltransferase
LDIGCGGGWTVLDALQLGIKARGIEPVKELKEFGCDLMEKNGFDRSCIQQDDLSVLASLPDASEDCIALLSVIPHVPSENWNKVHNDIVRVLKPGGKLIVAYRNELFDFFTFNSITLEFYDRTLWDKKEFTSLNNTETIDLLKGLITHPDLPGKYFTAAEDQSFGKLENILNIPDLIEVQVNSYKNFLEANAEHKVDSGITKVFKDIFPIEEFSGLATIEYISYRFEKPKYTVQECNQRGLTYSAALKATLRLVAYDINEEKQTKQVLSAKEQEVYMSDIPLMTPRGTFVVNGIERVCVNQMHRSPGVFFDHDKGKTHASGKLLFSCRVIPYRGSWLDFEYDTKEI